MCAMACEPRYQIGIQMTKTMIALLLLSLGLTACIVEPGPGYGARGYNGGGHAGYYEPRGDR